MRRRTFVRFLLGSVLIVGLLITRSTRTAIAACGDQGSLINNAQPQVDSGQIITFVDNDCTTSDTWYFYDSSNPGLGWQVLATGITQYVLNTTSYPAHDNSSYYAIDACDTSCPPSFSFNEYAAVNPSDPWAYQGVVPTGDGNGTHDASWFLETKTNGTSLPGDDCSFDDAFWGGLTDVDNTGTFYQVGFYSMHSTTAGNYTGGINSCGTPYSATGIEPFIAVAGMPAYSVTCYQGSSYGGAEGIAGTGCYAPGEAFGFNTGMDAFINYQIFTIAPCESEATVNGYEFATISDCSATHGYYLDNQSPITGAIEEEQNSAGATNVSDPTYANNVFYFRDDMTVEDYLTNTGGGPYALPVSGLICAGVEPPNFGTTVNNGGYGFQTGTYQGSSAC